jgi:hypothetical protein
MTIKPKKYCTGVHALLETRSVGSLTMAVMRLKCKSWSCPVCSVEKAYIIGERCRNGFTANEARFLTLTMAHNTSTEQSLIDIKKAWNRLRLAITRKFGSLKFCWVIEGHKTSPYPHMHVIIDKFIPKKWLDAHTERVGFGKISDIRKIKDKHIMGYIVKYLGKGIGNFHVENALKRLKGRRVGFSRHLSLPTRAKAVWIRAGILDTTEAPEVLASRLEQAGKAAGYVNATTQIGKNFSSTTFSEKTIDENETRYTSEWAKAENYRQTRFRAVSGRRKADLIHRYRPLATARPPEVAWSAFLDLFNKPRVKTSMGTRQELYAPAGSPN